MPAVLPDQDFQAFIDRHDLAGKLAALHWQRLGVGCAAAFGVVGYNLWGGHAEDTAVALVEWGSGIYLAASAIALGWRRQVLLASLHRPHAGAREQALAVADYVNSRGALLLAVAAAGHVLFLVSSYLQVRLGIHPAGLALAGFLLPTVGLLVHGVAQVPNDRQLVALHHRHARSGEPVQGGAEAIR
jgi:hypothetical protein